MTQRDRWVRAPTTLLNACKDVTSEPTGPDQDGDTGGSGEAGRLTPSHTWAAAWAAWGSTIMRRSPRLTGPVALGVTPAKLVALLTTIGVTVS